MPVYEYRCGACGKEFERYMATSGAAVACPACASANVKRTLSVVSVKSGGGFAASSAPAGGGCCGGGCSCH
ncbi:MAG: zinc ribbon domain-containing protein [Candidatus Rokubacteria bacterium]|nr:zinc ribbon domain-containing protein [Candidatus Rokubacteria bacterium]